MCAKDRSLRGVCPECISVVGMTGKEVSYKSDVQVYGPNVLTEQEVTPMRNDFGMWIVNIGSALGSLCKPNLKIERFLWFEIER